MQENANILATAITMYNSPLSLGGRREELVIYNTKIFRNCHPVFSGLVKDHYLKANSGKPNVSKTFPRKLNSGFL